MLVLEVPRLDTMRNKHCLTRKLALKVKVIGHHRVAIIKPMVNIFCEDTLYQRFFYKLITYLRINFEFRSSTTQSPPQERPEGSQRMVERGTFSIPLQLKRCNG